MEKPTRVRFELYRGSRPSNYAELVAEGITRTVDLESGMYEKLHNDDYELNDGKAFGIEKKHIPCSDITPPSKKQVNEFLDFVAMGDITALPPAVTYVHCLHGKDRTGFMCAAYRMKVMGWSYKDAVKEMFEMGFHKAPYIWWVPFLLLHRKK